MKAETAQNQKNLVYTKPQLVKLGNVESIKAYHGQNYDGVGSGRTDQN